MLIVGGRGNYTVMTGDGVDDAPSLKSAPVGIATGMEGSDITKDTPDLVLAGARFRPSQRKGCVSPSDHLPSVRVTRRSAIGV